MKHLEIWVALIVWLLFSATYDVLMDNRITELETGKVVRADTIRIFEIWNCGGTVDTAVTGMPLILAAIVDTPANADFSVDSIAAICDHRGFVDIYNCSICAEALKHWKRTLNPSGDEIVKITPLPPTYVTMRSGKRIRMSPGTLNWTAVGDDGMVGTADHYDLRMTTDSSLSWDQWIAVPTNQPLPAGESESLSVDIPQSFYFRIRAYDEAGNWSKSNIHKRCFNVAGDANGDGTVDISDITWTVAWMFNGGPAPECEE